MPEVGVELGANDGDVCEEDEVADSKAVRIGNPLTLGRMKRDRCCRTPVSQRTSGLKGFGEAPSSRAAGAGSGTGLQA